MNAVSLCLYTTLVIMFPIVLCRPINYYCSTRSVMADDDEMTDVEDELSAEENKSNHDVANTEIEADGISEEERMHTAYPPEGAGLFRDPAEILGHKFTSSVTINLCEVILNEKANEITDIKFSGRGNKTCVDVCVQYRLNMKLDGPVSVDLVENYCDYTGATIFDAENESDFRTTCTCMYKMRCNQRSKVLMYIFEANCKGFLKISVTELMRNKNIT